MESGDATQALAWRPQRKSSARGAHSPATTAPEGRVVPARFERRGATPPPASEPAPPTETPAGGPADEERLRRAFEEGMREGRERERAERAAQDVVEAAGLLAQVRAAAVDVLLELAGAVAEQWLRREVERDPAEVGRHAARCLKRLPPNGPLKLRLHPKDQEALLAIAPRPEWLEAEAGHLRLVADESLSRGECVVESERGRVDGRRAASLEAARELLRDVLAEALGGGGA